MKTRRKTLELSIEYDDKNEAIKCIQRVIKDLRLSQTNYGRQLLNGCFINWGVTLNELPSYRVEMINGKQCIVVPSKMNEDV